MVERICDRIAIIKYGHIITEANIKELESKGVNLEDFYRETIEKADVVAAQAKEAAAKEDKPLEPAPALADKKEE